jgi:GH15 family glucan-1,4-alpha-glucosidase
MSATPKIQDYAAIGNGRSAALVSRDGSLDWLCWPRFDSPSLFGALLDRRVGGCWRIAPAEPSRIERGYLPETNVLQTRFHTDAGTAELIDFMPAASEEQKGKMLWPEQELVRRIACEWGEAVVQVHFEPRPDFGRAQVKIQDAGKLGLRIRCGSNLFTLHSSVKLTPAAEGIATARIHLKAGQALAFSLTHSTEGPAVLPPAELADEKLALTVGWWRRQPGSGPPGLCPDRGLRQ